MMSVKSTNSNRDITKYDDSIQGLRGLAIICIILSHMFGSTFGNYGGFGAAIFSAISGYIACSKSRSSQVYLSAKQIAYRILKLYPLYFLVTCITATYLNPSIQYGAKTSESIIAFVANVLMIQTYVPNIIFYGTFSQVGWYLPFVVLCVLCTNLISRSWRKWGGYRLAFL